jgi:glycine cleavage system H protein
MNLPPSLLYTSDHEWVRVEDDVVRIGITDYAQDALGDVVFVQLPEIGTSVATGGSFSEVESTKSVSDIYAPVDGVVTATNDLLDAQPDLLNSDPYGDGWICMIRFSDASQIDGLLDAAGYQQLLDG